MKYAAILIGLIVMCVPDDASLGRMTVQLMVGLAIFIYGIGTLINESED